MRGLRIGAALVLLALAPSAWADVFRPAYLELRELDAETWEVLWKVPARDDGARLALELLLPPDTEVVSMPRGFFANGAYAERSRVRRPGGLAGATLEFTGVGRSSVDVLARVERADGSSQVERLAAAQTRFTVRAAERGAEVARSYLVLGVEHILGGVDHLLFVAALLLLVKSLKRAIGTITAFTLAHSLTLAAATLGWVHVPQPPVEALIAASIVFVAGEIVQGVRGTPGLGARAPWLIAFAFGLLHGLGFAGALAEVGLPERAIPLALLFFNLGVELGQLAFVLVLAGVAGLARPLLARAPRWLAELPAYAIGGVAAFWFFDRVAELFV